VLQPVFGQDEAVARWTFERLQLEACPPYVGIGFTKDGQTFCGGAVLNNFNGSNIDLSIYGHGCLTRDSIKTIYTYAFIQAGVHRITARTKRSNKHMLKLLPRMSFVFEGVEKRYFGKDKADDAFIYALFIENAQDWIN
jgi:RimJ/RimL family protein N-acetyltransferase